MVTIHLSAACWYDTRSDFSIDSSVDKVYSHYLVTQLSLKHNFHVVDMVPLQHAKEQLACNHGMGKPAKIIGSGEEFPQMALYYLHHNVGILNREEFAKTKTTNHGTHVVKTSPVEDWWARFKDEIYG